MSGWARIVLSSNQWELVSECHNAGVGMRARMLILVGVVSLLAAAALAISSPAGAQPSADDATFLDDDFATTPVIPEPATMALAGFGFTALGMGYHQHRKRS